MNFSSQAHQAQQGAQRSFNGGYPPQSFLAGFQNGSQGVNMRLSSQQWLFNYVQTVQGTLQICQELRDLGVDSDVTDQIVGIVENTLRRDIPGLEPTQDEYLVEDVSNAEGLQNAFSLLRNFGIDIEGEFDFDRKAADDMSRQAKKRAA